MNRRCWRTYLAAGCCFLYGILAVCAETLPAGTPLEIRLLQPPSSYSTMQGTLINGVLVAPVSEGGKILVPLGTTVGGSVVSVRKVGWGVAHETAEIELKFDRIMLADRQAFPSGPDLQGAMRQDRFTSGVSFTF